MIASELISNI